MHQIPIILLKKISSQVLSFFEEMPSYSTSFSVTNSLFPEYEDLFPQVYGAKLGILIDRSSNIPIHEISEYINSGSLDISNLIQPVVRNLRKYMDILLQEYIKLILREMKG